MCEDIITYIDTTPDCMAEVDSKTTEVDNIAWSKLSLCGSPFLSLPLPLSLFLAGIFVCARAL